MFIEIYDLNTFCSYWDFASGKACSPSLFYSSTDTKAHRVKTLVQTIHLADNTGKPPDSDLGCSTYHHCPKLRKPEHCEGCHTLSYHAQ